VLALILGGSALFALVAMAHHPVLHGHGAAALVMSANAVSRTTALVHGALIALVLLQWLAIGELAPALGASGWPWRSGTRLWGFGTGALAGAALVSGFLVPDLAAVASAGAMTPDAAVQHMHAFHLVNQRLAQVGSLCLLAAMGAVSLGLWREGGILRLASGLGLAVALGAGAALLLGALVLEVRGMTLVIAGLSAWLLAIAMALFTRAAPHT
jgi:hypothetical protein